MKYVLIILSFFVITLCNGLEAGNIATKFVDPPVFKILPNDSIDDIFNKYGKSKIYTTPLAHNYILYFDYENKIGLIFWIYQTDPKRICSVIITKVNSDNPITDLHSYASLMSSTQKEDSKVEKPPAFSIDGELTVHGIKFGMSKEMIENHLKTKLLMNKIEASIYWEVREGEEIVDYGSQDFRFEKGKLVYLSWSGVDP